MLSLFTKKINQAHDKTFMLLQCLLCYFVCALTNREMFFHPILCFKSLLFLCLFASLIPANANKTNGKINPQYVT